MHSLGDLIKKHMKPTDRRTLTAALVLEDVRAALQELFPDHAAGIKAVSYESRVLKLQCDRSVIAEEIRLREPEVLAAINAKIGEDAVDRIRVN